MARKAMVAWLEAAQSNPSRASTARHLADECVVIAGKGTASPATDWILARSVVHRTIGVRPCMVCFQPWKWANVMQMFLGSWSADKDERSLARQVASLLMAGWVLGYRRDRSLHCAGDGVLEPDAATAVALVAEQRVRDWRRQHNMEDEADFAFAFENFEAAQHAGGHHLASAWVEARAAQHELLLPDAAAVMEATARRPQPSQAPITRAPVRSWTMSRRRGIRLHPNVADTPEAISNRAEALGRVFKQCGALQPLGYISERLDQEWTQACARLGQRLVTASEAVTVSNAIRTASELETFMRSRGRPYPPQHVDLDAFLHDPVAAPAPVRALASLRWLVNQGNLAWELGGLTPPRHVAHQGRRRKSGQATAVAPPMLRFLEEKVERLHATGEPRWSALLASWIAAAGCLRQKHIARSQPRKLTRSTLHCECSRGKQRQLRKGFSYCLPSCFSTGWPWAQALRHAFRGGQEKMWALFR